MFKSRSASLWIGFFCFIFFCNTANEKHLSSSVLKSEEEYEFQ